MPDGEIVRSPSQPEIMTAMLEQLSVRPGQRVLELGAGTGYNAALLAHLVGLTGAVTAVDIAGRPQTEALRRQGGERMAYFDALTSASFKQDRNGHMLFFPWGTLGRGYVLATEEQHRTAKVIVRGCLVSSLLLGVGVGVTFGILYACATLVCLYGLYVYEVCSLTRGLAKATEPLTRDEIYRNQIVSRSLAGLWWMEMASLGAVLLGATALWTGVDRSVRMIGITGISAGCGVWIGYMIRMKRKLKRAR